MDLENARRRIRDLDEAILERVAERIRLAREVAAIKVASDLPTVDYRQEREVLERGRRVAESVALDPELAQELLSRLMSASVTEQEAERLRFAATGKGKTAVVVGGAGRMGRWMVGFLGAQEFTIEVLDPLAPAGLDADVESHLADFDLVVCAVPPGRAAELYLEWSKRSLGGVVCDIASIKTPLVEPIRRLQAAGARVASFHPLFGPDTRVLRGADVVLCDTGDREAEEFVAGLFAPTSARLVRIGLDQHDRLMADVLTLAHATALAYASARADAGPPGVDLHSTTDRALRDLAAALVRESPEVYFEIQTANPYSAAAVARLAKAVERLAALTASRDFEGFRNWMETTSERLNEAGDTAGK